MERLSIVCLLFVLGCGPQEADIQRSGSPVAVEPDTKPDAESRDKEGTAATAPAAAATGVTMVAKAEWSSTVCMDETGKEAPPELIVAITLSGKPAAEASAYRFLRVTKAEGDDGAALELGDDFSFDMSFEEFVKVRREDDFSNRHPADGVRVAIELKHPAGKITKIAAIEGSIKLKTGGTRKTIERSGLAGKAGTVIDDPALKAAGIEQLRLGEITAKKLSLEIRGNDEAIDSIQIVDAAGEKLNNVKGRSSSGKQVQYDLFCDEKLPADAALKITLLINTRELDVPFRFQDLAVPPVP